MYINSCSLDECQQNKTCDPVDSIIHLSSNLFLVVLVEALIEISLLLNKLLYSCGSSSIAQGYNKVQCFIKNYN